MHGRDQQSVTLSKNDEGEQSFLSRLKITRRKLLLLVGMSASAALEACTPNSTPPPVKAPERQLSPAEKNESIRKKMAELLGYRKGMSKDNFRKALVERSISNPTWMNGQDVGEIATLAGKSTHLKLRENGEPAIVESDRYSFPKSSDNTHDVSRFPGSDPTEFLYVYSATTVEKARVNKAISAGLGQDGFDDVMFSLFDWVIAQEKVLHIDFLSKDSNISKFESPNKLDTSHIDLSNGTFGLSMVAVNLDHGSLNGIISAHIALKAHKILEFAEETGFSLEDAITGTLVNEAVGVMQMQEYYSLLKPTDINSVQHAESFSTIAHYLASIDPEFATFMLGSSYRKLVAVIANEIRLLAKKK